MPERISGSAKREELIEIASRLFYSQGYGTTGVKQIIEEAGIAKGTFYSHFASKEELGVAWLRDRHERWNGWLAAEIEPLDSPGAKILGMFGFLEGWMKETGYRGCAFINTCAETPDCSSPLREEVESHKHGLHEMFQRFATAHFGHAGPAGGHQGSVLYLLFEGALLEAQIFREPWPIQAARSHAENILAATS